MKDSERDIVPNNCGIDECLAVDGNCEAFEKWLKDQGTEPIPSYRWEPAARMQDKKLAECFDVNGCIFDQPVKAAGVDNA